MCVRDMHMCVRGIYAYVCEIYACMCEGDINLCMYVRGRYKYACAWERDNMNVFVEDRY